MRIGNLKLPVPFPRLTFTDPPKEEVRSARKAVYLSQEEAAHLVGLGQQERWAEYENGTRHMDAARWILFLLLTGQHPRWRLKRKKPPKPQSEDSAEWRTADG